MEDYTRKNVIISENRDVAVRSFMSKAYGWMTAALIMTGITAHYVANNPAIYKWIFSSTFTFIGIIVLQFALVIAISSLVDRASAPVLMLMFIIYSISLGVLLSSIFLVYTRETLTQVFFICAGMFAATSAFGLLTKKDLSGLGRFMFMGLIGIIIASIANIFLKSPAIYWITSYIGVFVFAGLTAADTQKLKNMALSLESANSEFEVKLSIVGALILYLDFINLFIFLLRIFGSRD